MPMVGFAMVASDARDGRKREFLMVGAFAPGLV